MEHLVWHCVPILVSTESGAVQPDPFPSQSVPYYSPFVQYKIMKIRNYLANIDSSYLALAFAFIAWGMVFAVAHIDGASIPAGFKLIKLNDYHQAYEIYVKDSV